MLEQKTLRLFLWKNFIYTLLILLAYLLQETPALFPVALRPVRRFSFWSSGAAAAC